MVTHPNNPHRPYTPWQTKVKFRLTQLEAIEFPTLDQQQKMQELRIKLYGNLQWFRKVRTSKNDNDTSSTAK